MSGPVTAPPGDPHVVWARHQRSLRAYVQARVDTPAVVDDLLQDVYLKLHTRLHQIRDPGAVRGWLYRVAQHAIADHFRKRRPAEAVPAALPSPAPDPADAARQGLARCLPPFVEALPDRYRVPIQMAELEGKTQQQVADALGLSLSGAKSRVQRGRARLRDDLLKCCEIEVRGGAIVDFTRRTPLADQGRHLSPRLKLRPSARSS